MIIHAGATLDTSNTPHSKGEIADTKKGDALTRHSWLGARRNQSHGDRMGGSDLQQLCSEVGT